MKWMCSGQMDKKDILKTVFNDEALYDIISATRGPDNEDEYIKYLFTARIRFLAGMGNNGYFAQIRSTKYVSEDMVKGFLAHLDNISKHYLVHVSTALIALERLKLIEADEYDFLTSLIVIIRHSFYDTGDEKYVQSVSSVLERFRYVWASI